MACVAMTVGLQSITSLPGRAGDKIDDWMSEKLGFSPRQRHLTWHYLKGLWEQVLAIIPISVFQVCGLLEGVRLGFR